MNACCTIRRAAADAVILYFGDTIDPTIHHNLMQCHEHLRPHLGRGIRSLVPSYSSLLIRYDPFVWSEVRVRNFLRDHCRQDISTAQEKDTVLEIPVWYNPSVGWDLESVARQHDLTIDEIIALHHQREYRVYAVGFLPGFGYMGRLDERLNTPRLSTPRPHLPAGSVAIADMQTAIYPMASPGGWHILGRTPLEMFDPLREPASLMQVGMRVRFVPIDRARYLALGGMLS